MSTSRSAARRLAPGRIARALVGGSRAHGLGVRDDDGRVLSIARQVAEHDDLAGVGDPAGLDHDVRGWVRSVAQKRELADEVAGYATADAAVAQAHHLAFA